MPVSVDFYHLCRLARLAPSPEGQAQFAHQSEGILAYMDNLSTVDTSGVAPMYSPIADQEYLRGFLREDVAQRVCTREEILANAPESDGPFFTVPRIVEGK